jgi:putative transposase
MVDHLRDHYQASERHACRVLLMVRGTYCYQGHREPWTELRMRIREIAQSRVRYGYRKIRVLLNRQGWDVGKHLVHRLYKEEGLALRNDHNARGKQSGTGKSASLPQHRIEPGASTSLPISCKMGRASRR